MAAEKAVDYIKDGMVVGLGTGSTVYYAIKKIGKLVESGIGVIGIPTSKQTEKLANECKIPLSSLDEYNVLDITIDGADEVDPKFNLIKGMGGALLREKIIACSSKKEIIVIDASKLVDVLGTKSHLPVEVVPFGWRSCAEKLKKLGCTPTIRMSENIVYITDNENYILDCEFKNIQNPKELEKEINDIPGVVENGLFINLTDIVVVGTEKGADVKKNLSRANV